MVAFSIVKPLNCTTRDASSLIRRLYTIEELVVSSIIAGVAGIRPGSGHCSTISSTILVVAVMHFVYVAYFYPLRTRLDHYFSLFFAAVQVVMGFACVVATKKIEDEGEGGAEAPLKVLSVTVLVMFAGFFMQTIVQGFWTFYTMSRRRAVGASGGKERRRRLQIHTGNNSTTASSSTSSSTPTNTTTTTNSDHTSSASLSSSFSSNSSGASSRYTSASSNSTDVSMEEIDAFLSEGENERHRQIDVAESEGHLSVPFLDTADTDHYKDAPPTNPILCVQQR